MKLNPSAKPFTPSTGRTSNLNAETSVPKKGSGSEDRSPRPPSKLNPGTPAATGGPSSTPKATRSHQLETFVRHGHGAEIDRMVQNDSGVTVGDLHHARNVALNGLRFDTANHLAEHIENKGGGDIPRITYLGNSLYGQQGTRGLVPNSALDQRDFGGNLYRDIQLVLPEPRTTPPGLTEEETKRFFKQVESIPKIEAFALLRKPDPQ